MKAKRFLSGLFFILILNAAAGHAFELPDTPEEAAFKKEMVAFYQKELIYGQEKSKERNALYKEIESLQGAFDPKDMAKAKKAEQKILELQSKLEAITEETARHEVGSATFNMKAAEFRLQRAKKIVAAIEDRKKNAAKAGAALASQKR